MKILLVDDSETDQQIIALSVKKGVPDARITILDDAADLLEHLVTNHYDCLLLDYSMPSIDGLQVLELLSAAYDNPFRPPVVMLTGMGDENVAVKAMRKGAYDYLRKDDIDADLIGRTIERVVQRVELERELERSNRMLAMLALTDETTKLGNRNAFDLALANALRLASAEQARVALVLAELPALRELARERGRETGDAVLKVVARRLRAVMRPDDTLFRIGDDQFAVIVEKRLQLRTVDIIAARMLDAIREPVPLPGGETVELQGVIGEAAYPDDGDNAYALLSAADVSMTSARAGVLAADPSPDP